MDINKIKNIINDNDVDDATDIIIANDTTGEDSSIAFELIEDKACCIRLTRHILLIAQPEYSKGAAEKMLKKCCYGSF